MSSDEDYEDFYSDYDDYDDGAEDYHDYLPEDEGEGYASPDLDLGEEYEDPGTFHATHEDVEEYEAEALSAWIDYEGYEGRYGFHEGVVEEDYDCERNFEAPSTWAEPGNYDERLGFYEDAEEDEDEEGYYEEHRHAVYEDQSVNYEGRHGFYQDEDEEGYYEEPHQASYEEQSVPASPEYYDDDTDSDGDWSPQIAPAFQTRYNEISSPLLSHSPRTGEYVPPASRQSYYFPYGQTPQTETATRYGVSIRSISARSESGRWLHWQRTDHSTGEVEVETAQVGETLGQGTYGQVYDLENHRRPLVAKRFFKRFSRATSTEIRNLADVGQLRGVAQDVDGAPIAIIYKQPGDKLRNLQRKHDSDIAGLTQREYKRFLEKTSEAVAREVVEEAKRTGLRHTDAHPGNVLLEYDFHYNPRGTRVTDMKVDAALIDWGLADVVSRHEDWDRMYRRELRNARKNFGLQGS